MQEHTVGNLFLMCGTHHDQKTRGQIPIDWLEMHAAHPFNVRRNMTSGAIAGVFAGDEVRAQLGPMGFAYQFSGDAHAVVIWTDDIPALSFMKEGRGITLNLILYEPGAGVVLRIDKGTMVVNTGVWDYTYEGPLLRIWSAKLKRSVELRFNRGLVDIEKGTFKGRHIQLDVGPNGLKFSSGSQFFGEGPHRNMGIILGKQVGIGSGMIAVGSQ